MLKKTFFGAALAVAIVVTPFALGAFQTPTESAPCSCCGDACSCELCLCDEIGCACDTGGDCACEPDCCVACCAK